MSFFKTAVITTLYLATQLTFSQSTNLLQNIQDRDQINLDGLWQIIVDPLENGYYNHRYLPKDNGYFKNEKVKAPSDRIEYDFDTDVEIMVPGDWNTQDDKLYYYEGTVWYKKSFDFTSKSGERSYMHFDAVNYEAKVYLNGEYLGQHIGGYTPFQFEVTKLLKPKDNFLVVKVDNKRLREGVPTLNTDWWNYGGITRSVRLVSVPEKHIKDYFIHLDKKDSKTISGYVELAGSSANDQVTIAIPELNIQEKLKVDASGKANFAIKSNPVLWSTTNPKLYTVTIKTSTDEVNDQIGFKTIATEGSKMVLNGKSIFLKGISIHEEAPFKTGRVTSLEECKVLLNWAKELGCNFVRLAHYPHSEAMVREAERIGLLVWSEIPVYWTILYDNAATYANAENQLEEMIFRDKNRVGVGLWSIANETPVSEQRNTFLGKLATKARSLDTTRLITAALDTHSGSKGEKIIDDPLGKIVDVIGVNSYCGWYGGKPESCPSIKWKNTYDKPMIMSEYGAGALQGHHGDKGQRWTEEYQASVYENNLSMMRKIDFLAGASPWILMDFRSPRRHLKKIQKDYNRKGLISEQGVKKQAFYVLQKYYKEENN